MKRIISFFLSVMLAVSAVTGEFAITADSTEAYNSGINSEMEISGTNSFGTMMADAFSTKSDEIEENNGYNVFSAEMTEPGKYTVDVETQKDSLLVLGIYEETTNKMAASGQTAVTYEDTSVTVEIDKDKIPEYYYIRAYLVNPENMRPLCTMYECPTYTKEMQEFLKKTTDDFNSDLVLNLDEDKTNNFAVYKSGTVLSDDKGGKNTVVSADDTNFVYVIDNADDEVKGLEKGDVYSQEYGDGQILIVKVKSVSIDEDRVTIYGQDTDMEDVFDFYKIEGASDGDDTVYDESTCGEGVEYLGKNGEAQSASYARIGNEGSITEGDDFKFKNKDGTFYGTIGIKVKTSYKAYYDVNWLGKDRAYLELKATLTGKLSITAKAKAEHKWTLGSITIFNKPFVKVSVSVELSLSADVSIDISGTIEEVIGFVSDSDKNGVENISKKPSFNPDKKIVNIEGKIKISLDLKLEAKIHVLDNNIFTASIKAGPFLEVSFKPESGFLPENGKLHQCNICIKGEIYGGVAFEFKISILKNIEWRPVYTEARIKIADFYISQRGGEGVTAGFGDCPYKAYLFTAKLVDNDNNPIQGAKIVITARDNSYNKEYTTDGEGKIQCYLGINGYILKASKEGYVDREKSFMIVFGSKDLQIVTYSVDSIGKNVFKTPFGSYVVLPNGLMELFDNFGKDFRSAVENYPLNKGYIKQVSFGSYHSAAITTNGDLYVWGANWDGQLGDGTTIDSYVPKKIMSNVASVSLGYLHSAAITTNGDLYTWGVNHYGQLGDGTTTNNYVPKKIMSNVASVNLGDYYSAAITTNGDLYTWGQNLYGQLGNGETSAYKANPNPEKIMSNVASVSLGDEYSAVITTNGDLYTWGWNNNGKLGDGTTDNRSVPKKIMSNVASVSLGDYYSAVITTNGDLYTWGNNYFGQLGDGTTDNRSVPKKIMSNVASVSLGSSHSAAITTNGDLYTWGYNCDGQLGDGTTDNRSVPKKIMSNVASVSLGGFYSAAITTNGDLYTWGVNNYGALGDGTTKNCSSVPIKIMENVASISLSLGFYQSAAITTNGDLYTWGDNNYGMLGDGTTTSSSVPVKIDIPPKTSSARISADMPIFFTENEEQLIMPYEEQTDKQDETADEVQEEQPMAIAEINDPNIVTDHTQAPAPTPDVLPDTAQRFSGLLPNEVYNCYGMKSKTSAEPFDSDNLLFITQTVSDGSGNLNFSYLPDEDYANAEIFVKAMTDFEIPIPVFDRAEVGEDQVTLSWNAVPNASQYKVYKIMNGVYTENKIVNGTSCTFDQLMSGVTYGFAAVSCVNGEWAEPSASDAVYFIIRKQIEVLKGDINDDGTINNKDLILLRTMISEQSSEEAAYSEAADMDDDGKINNKDLILLRTALSEMTG